jgi:hypothetical protein
VVWSVHCSLLAEDAIKSAIKDYQMKREKRLAMASVGVSNNRTVLDSLLDQQGTGVTQEVMAA